MDDLAQFKQTFFAECEELLGDLEGHLMALQAGEGDNGTLNAVFRAIHSIKGGAGAFGFDRLVAFAKGAEAAGFKVIIAGAGGAAHLPGMIASMTHVPVLGVPVQSKALSGQDSLLSIVQMPAGIPVGTLAIGEAGATNAGLLAAAILANGDAALAERLKAYRAAQTDSVAERPV